MIQNKKKMKKEVNLRGESSIFLPTKGKQWFDDSKSSKSQKEDENHPQDGDSTTSMEDGEILDSDKQSNPSRRKSIRILSIQDLPPQNFEDFHSLKKRKSNSTSSKEQMELDLQNKTKEDDTLEVESNHEEVGRKDFDEKANEEQSKIRISKKKNPPMVFNNQVNTVWTPTYVSTLSYENVDSVELNRRSGKAMGIQLPVFSVHFATKTHLSIKLNIEIYLMEK